MSFETLLIFTAATFVIVATPGAAAIAAASQGASHGVSRALVSVVGIASANVVYFFLSAVGIASLIIASNLAFSVIKWVGVAYLAWLGLTALLSPNGGIRIDQRRGSAIIPKLFAHGFVIEFANPKALLYFSAILPQFINTDEPILQQLFLMGGITLIIDLSVYSCYAFLGDIIVRSGLKPWIVKTLNRTAGVALLFTAMRMASVQAR